MRTASRVRRSSSEALPQTDEARCNPPLKGEGRTAEGSPGWGCGDAACAGHAAYAEAPSPPPGPLTRADLPQPNFAIARVRPLNKVAEGGNSRLRLGEVTTALRRPARQSAIEPIRHRLGDGVAVLLQHHHVAVAVNPGIRQPQERALYAGLRQIADRAVVVGRMVRRLRSD